MIGGNSEVIEAFLTQSLYKVKSYTGRMRFEGKKIYSYGQLMGQLVPLNNGRDALILRDEEVKSGISHQRRLEWRATENQKHLVIKTIEEDGKWRINESELTYQEEIRNKLTNIGLYTRFFGFLVRLKELIWRLAGIKKLREKLLRTEADNVLFHK